MLQRTYGCISFKFCVFYKYFFIKNLFIYFLERGEGREKARTTSVPGCLSYAPYWGPGPQPRHVPWLGIEPATLCFAGRHSIHWATPARLHLVFWVPLSLVIVFVLKSILSGISITTPAFSCCCFYLQDISFPIPLFSVPVCLLVWSECRLIHSATLWRVSFVWSIW